MGVYAFLLALTFIFFHPFNSSLLLCICTHTQAGEKMQALEKEGKNIGLASTVIDDLLLFGRLFDHFLNPRLGGAQDEGKCDLADALVSMSVVAHTLLIIREEMKTAFLFNGLYHDLQSEVKDFYVITARGLVDHEGKLLNFFFRGSDQLEGFFCILRALFPGVNFDVIQFCLRSGAATNTQGIYMEHDDLHNASKKNSNSTDKVNVRTWKGDRQLIGGGHDVFRSFWDQGGRKSLRICNLHSYWGEEGEDALTHA